MDLKDFHKAFDFILNKVEIPDGLCFVDIKINTSKYDEFKKQKHRQTSQRISGIM